MTDRKRPWWMLHWPSWLALVVFGGAFLAMNALVCHVPLSMATHKDVLGWPFVMWSKTDHPGLGDEWAYWVWDAGPFGTPLSDGGSWVLISIVSNANIGLAVILMATRTVEQFCRRHGIRLTVRSVLGMMGVLTGLFAAVRADPIGWYPEMASNVPRYAPVATLLAGIAIGLASLAVLDFIGWLFTKLPKREPSS